MPAYFHTSPVGALDGDQRKAIARLVTTAHCEIAGSLPQFVQVIFAENDLVTRHSVVGSIRAGRSDDTKDDLVRTLRVGIAGAAGLDVDDVEVFTFDVPASWVMEGGMLLPEPGGEEAWLGAYRARHAG